MLTLQADNKTLAARSLAVAGVVSALVGALHWLLRYQHHRCLPRGYKKGRFVTQGGGGEGDRTTSGHKVDRDGYTKKKAQIEDVDVIVIGSGIGGLTCAGLLSRAGQRCLVLEQHYIAGGCMHMFEDHGFEFDTGLHYCGNVDKRKKYLDLVCARPIEWAQMGSREDGYAYDEIVVGPDGAETAVKVPAGREAYASALEAAFPGSRGTVERWLDHLTKISKSDMYIELKLVRPVWLARLIAKLVSKKFFGFLQRSATEEVRNFSSDPRLRAVLLGIFGNYTDRPGTANIYTHATVAMHYLGGGYYPCGGSQEFARTIIPTIERTGGRVLVRKAVKQILVEAGHVVGVVMETGDELRARCVVSACGAANTWKRLVPASHVPPHIVGKVDAVGLSATIMYLFIGLDKSSSELDLPSRNVWRWPTAEDSDLDAMISAFQADPEHAPVPLFCGFPSAKDPTFAERFPGKSTAVLLSIGRHEWFSKWEGTKWGKRGDDYLAFKGMLERRILEEGLYHMWPQTRGHVAYTALGTSLSYNHFIGSQRGEAYGLRCTPDRFQSQDWLRPQTPLNGLYMTGQDVALFGFAGALMSGLLTAMAVLGYGAPLDVMSGRNLVEDLWHLDAASPSEYSVRSKAHQDKAYGR